MIEKTTVDQLERIEIAAQLPNVPNPMIEAKSVRIVLSALAEALQAINQLEARVNALEEKTGDHK